MLVHECCVKDSIHKGVDAGVKLLIPFAVCCAIFLWCFSRPPLHAPWTKLILREKFRDEVSISDKRIIADLENFVREQRFGWRPGYTYLEPPAGDISVECFSADGSRFYLDISSASSPTWISWQSADDYVNDRKPKVKHLSTGEHQALLLLLRFPRSDRAGSTTSLRFHRSATIAAKILNPGRSLDQAYRNLLTRRQILHYGTLCSGIAKRRD